MSTTFTLLCGRCGLSQREAAELLGVRLDTVKSWAIGRNPTPPGVIDELRGLYARITRAANEALKALAEAKAKADKIEIGLASDNHEARSLGWPCVGAHAAVLGIIAAKSTLPVKIIPRGSSPETAAAADAHGL